MGMIIKCETKIVKAPAPGSYNMSNISRSVLFSLFALLALAGLGACSSGAIQTEAKYPTGSDRPNTGGDIYAKPQSILGPEGLSIFGGKRDNDPGDSGIGVNSYLWRASLDTVSFMPLASADPFGGVILTDWYSAPGTETERFKVNVFIMGRQLRSDGIRVRIFKQIQKGDTWVDAEAAPETARQLEDTILTRARELRVAQLGE
jgi:hypothetical protein